MSSVIYLRLIALIYIVHPCGFIVRKLFTIVLALFILIYWLGGEHYYLLTCDC